MQGTDMNVDVNLKGKIRIDSAGQRLGKRDFGRLRQVSIKAAEPVGLNLALRFEGDPDISFPAHIMIASLSLQQVVNVVVEGISKKRTVSTILGGEIFNESMNGKRYELRKGEWLKLGGVYGEIRSIQMTADGIRLNYHGKVTSINVGSSQNQRNLMPNWLEWFSERHSVKMLWGTFVWLLGTLLGVIKWWKRP